MLHQLNVYEYLYETNCIPEQCAEPEFANLLRSPGIDSQRPVREPYLTYWPARLYTVNCFV
jgi:hypothetical protein